MTFRMRHLLFVLLLAASAGAQPATQPATSPAEEPPVIKGEPIGRVIREEDVKVAVRSVRHQVVYEIVKDVLTPAQLGPVPARLRCEVSLPPGLDTMPTFRSEVTNVEDDNANDLLKASRGPDGKASVGVVAGTIWNNESRQGPMWVESALPVFPRLPHTIGRIAGLFTLYIPAETKSFEFPLDKIGATAAVSDTVTMTLASCDIESNGVYRIKLRVKGPSGNRASAMSLVKSAIGIGPDRPDGRKGVPFGSMDISYDNDGVIVQFAPSVAKSVKKLQLIVITKTLEVPLQYDIRSRPMM